MDLHKSGFGFKFKAMGWFETERRKWNGLDILQIYTDFYEQRYIYKVKELRGIGRDLIIWALEELEAEAGVKLMEMRRLHGGWIYVPTAAGQVVYEGIKDLRAGLKRVMAEARRVGELVGDQE